MLLKDKQLEQLQENQLLMRQALVGNAIRMVESMKFNYYEFMVFKELYLIKLNFPQTPVEEIASNISNNSAFPFKKVMKIIKKLHDEKFVSFIDKEMNELHEENGLVL